MQAPPSYVVPTISVPDLCVIPRQPVPLKDESEPGAAGVYVLFKGDAVVYVGQSQNIVKRVGQHQKEGKKEFDSVAWLPLDDVSERLRLEGILVLAYLPTDNQMLALRLAKGRVSEMAYASFRRSSKRTR